MPPQELKDEELKDTRWEIIHALVRAMIPHVKFNAESMEEMALDASLAQARAAYIGLGLLADELPEDFFDGQQKSFIDAARSEYIRVVNTAAKE